MLNFLSCILCGSKAISVQSLALHHPPSALYPGNLERSSALLGGRPEQAGRRWDYRSWTKKMIHTCSNDLIFRGPQYARNPNCVDVHRLHPSKLRFFGRGESTNFGLSQSPSRAIGRGYELRVVWPMGTTAQTSAIGVCSRTFSGITQAQLFQKVFKPDSFCCTPKSGIFLIT